MSERWPEGPTWAVALTIYVGWGLLTWHFGALPLWVALPAGAWLVAWHGSLQHETVHGHPTRIAWINTAIATPPLGLWMPYAAYRETHLAHHRTPALADPRHDPEAFYVTAEQWRRTGPVLRWLLIANNTLLGRLTLGPALTVSGYWQGEWRRIRTGDFSHWRQVLGHFVGMAAVLIWVGPVVGMSLWLYLLIAYGGLSLTLLRSFVEHAPGPRQQDRTAIVEGGLIWRLLFLNNNLHVLHHAHPGLPWYAIGRRYKVERVALRASHGGQVFSGYAAVARRYLFQPKDHPVNGDC